VRITQRRGNPGRFAKISQNAFQGNGYPALVGQAFWPGFPFPVYASGDRFRKAAFGHVPGRRGSGKKELHRV